MGNALRFYKLHGCGNDYVYLNLFDAKVAAFWNGMTQARQAAFVQKTSDRRFGVGGDGVILFAPCQGFDGQMIMFNADGSMGNMCGNGLRCVAKMIYDLGIAQKEILHLQTGAGLRVVEITPKNGKAEQIKVDMGAADFSPQGVCLNAQGLTHPATAPTKEAVLAGNPVLDAPFVAEEKVWQINCVSMGNPHCVIFGQDPYALELEKIGPKFEKHPFFAQGVNTEFVQVLSPTHLVMRVWERGSGETFACGTGASGVAAVAVQNGISPKNTPITLQLRGGNLTIEVTDETVFMTGPATLVFEGDLEI